MLKQNLARIGRLSSIYMVGGIAPKVVGLLLLPVFTRYLVPEQYGIVRLSMQISQVLVMVVIFGSGYALKSLYFGTAPADRGELVKNATASQALVAGVLCLLLSAAGPWIAGPLLPNLPLAPDLLQALWLMIVWGCFWNALNGLSNAVLQLQERAMLSTVILLVRFFAQDLVGVLAVVFLGWLGFGRSGTLFFGSVLGGLLSLSVLLRASAGRLRWKAIRGILRDGVTFVPNNLGALLTVSANLWILTRLASAGATGIYGVAMLFAQFLTVPLYAIANATYPTVAGLIERGDASARREHARIYALTIIGGLIIALFLFVFSPVAIRLLAAPEYGEAGQVAPLLVIAWMFEGLTMTGSHIVIYFRKGLWLGAITLIGFALNAMLALALVPTYGLWGAASSLAVSLLFGAAANLGVGQRLYALPWRFGPVLRALAIFAAIAAADGLLTPGLAFGTGVLVKLFLFALVVPAMHLLKVVRIGELREIGKLVSSQVRGPEME